MGRFPTASEQEWNEYRNKRDAARHAKMEAERFRRFSTDIATAVLLLRNNGWTVTKLETPR